MNTQQIIVMNIVYAIGVVIVGLIIMRKKRAKVDSEFNSKQTAKVINRFNYYYNNPIMRRRFRRLVEMYTSLSAFDELEMKVKSVQIFERNLAIVILLPIVTFIVTRDVSMCILGGCLGLVYYEGTIEREVNKTFMEIVNELSLAISSIREKYLETDNIAMALRSAEKHRFLQTPINDIYRSLTDVNGKERLETMHRKHPIKTIKTLANVCWIVNEYGATKGDGGFDSFERNMTVLRQECDSEYRRLLKQKLAFQSLQTLCLLGAVLIPIFETFMLNQIPGTAILLKGFYGVVVHIAIIVASMVCYSYIGALTRPSVVNSVDKSPNIDEISKVYKVNKFIRKLYPKKLRTKQKLQSLIDSAISSKDFRYIYTAKVIYSVALFVSGFILVTFGMFSVKDNFKKNYGSLTLYNLPMKESQLNQIKTFDDAFLDMDSSKVDELRNEQYRLTLSKMIKQSIGGLSDNEIENQVDRILAKYDIVHNAGFKWWFLLVAYGCGVVGWFLPEITLKIRRKLVIYEATDDVMQLQTIMIVLSETTMNTFDAIKWLEAQSSIHKGILRLCHYSYMADPLKALRKLESKITNTDLKRIVRKLQSSVYNLSMHDAFSDMLMDKNQSLATRELLRNDELEQRKNSAKMVAMVPSVLAMIGCFMGPFMILGARNLSDTFSRLMSTVS